MIKDIKSSGVADVVVIIRNESPETKEDSRLKRVMRARHKLVYGLYRQLDHLVNRVKPDSLKQVDIGGLVADCPVVRVKPRMTACSDYFSADDYAAIQEYDLDLAIRFGFRILRGRALRMARHGVWSHHHGDNLVMRGGPAGFWEVMEGHTSTGSILQVLTEELDGGNVIYRSHGATVGHSFRKNQNNNYWRTAAVCRQEAERPL